MSAHETVNHPFEPVYNFDSKILILGTMASEASRKSGFYYGLPQNRFWKVLSILTNSQFPTTDREKSALLLNNGIALWDVLKSCEIVKSSDSSIKNPVANDFGKILCQTNITKIFANGSTAGRLYSKLIFPQTKIPAITLPSTSPANAAYSLERLIAEWSVILRE